MCPIQRCSSPNGLRAEAASLAHNLSIVSVVRNTCGCPCFSPTWVDRFAALFGLYGRCIQGWYHTGPVWYMFALNKKVRTTRSLGMVYSDRGRNLGLAHQDHRDDSRFVRHGHGPLRPCLRYGPGYAFAKRSSTPCEQTCPELRVCVLTRSMSPPDAAVRTWNDPWATPFCGCPTVLCPLSNRTLAVLAQSSYRFALAFPILVIRPWLALATVPEEWRFGVGLVLSALGNPSDQIRASECYNARVHKRCPIAV